MFAECANGVRAMVMVVGSKRSVLEVGSISGKVNQQAG